MALLLKGKFIGNTMLNGRFTNDTMVKGDFGVVMRVGGTGDPYEGEYTVIPKTYGQTLATTHKYMLDDVTVTAIPYYETANPYGGNTVYIGGELDG